MSPPPAIRWTPSDSDDAPPQPAMVSASDRERFNTPAGGIWVYTKAALLAVDASETGKAAFNSLLDAMPVEDSYMISWDKVQGQGHKLFARYENVMAFITALLELPKEYRAAYEVIRPDGPTKAHAVLEFVTAEPDTLHTRLTMTVAQIREKVKTLYGIDAEVYVSCGSQGVPGNYKNSYHITIGNLVFGSNCDGKMAAFFAVTQDTHDVSSDWFYTKDAATGKRVPIVDQKIYDRFRSMPTLFSCKKGDAAPFRRISQDPLLDIFDPVPCVRDIASDYLLFQNTLPANTPVSVPLLPYGTDKNDKRGSSSAVPRASAQHQPSVQQSNLPFSLDRLQQLLVKFGDNASVVKGDSVRKNRWGDSYIVPCDQRKQSRECLHCPNRIHTSNNCRLIVTYDNSHRWRVEYCCYAEGCKNLAPRCIGFITSGEPPAAGADAPAESNGVFSRQPDETYCEPLLKKLPVNKRCMAVRSACGTGKTKGIVNTLVDQDSVDDLQVVVVCHRKSLSKKVRQMFPSLKGSDWFHYASHKGPIDIREHPYVIVQSESLARLMYEGLSKDSNKKTIVIIDEAVSVIHQFKSKCGNPEAAQAMFYHLCRYADSVIALDGYLDQNTLDIFEKYTGERAYLIHNTYQSRADHKVQFTHDVKGAAQQMFKRVEEGGRCIAPCYSKKFAEKLYRQAKLKFGDTKKVKLYTKDCTLDGTDVNILWADVDLVIFTSTIDCGISFELADAFEWCYAFFDNRTGPTHFAAAQMISRARDVKKFIISCTQGECYDESLDKTTILNDPNMLQRIRNADVRFFGVVGYAGKRNLHMTWETCSPIAASIVFSELSARQTRQDIHWYLRDLLQQDGAQVDREWLKFEEAKEPAMDAAAVEAVVLEGQNENALVNGVIRKYNFNGFDPEDKETLLRYDRAAKLNAYENLNQLAVNGAGFAEAINRREQDVAKCALGIELIDAAAQMDQNAIDSVAISAGLFGGNYMLNANRAAVELLEVITGGVDPFNIPEISSTVIAARLECESVISTDRGGKERHDLMVSAAKSKQVGDVYKKWVLTKPSLHTPSRPYKGGPLSLVKAVSMLNHVLSVMYDMTFKREGNTQINGEKIFQYASRESEDFPRVNPDFSCHKTKPSIKLWAQAPLRDLSEGDIIQVGKRHLQLAPGYAARQAGDYGCLPLPPIRPEDLHPASKKRRMLGGIE